MRGSGGYTVFAPEAVRNLRWDDTHRSCHWVSISAIPGMPAVEIGASNRYVKRAGESFYLWVAILKEKLLFERPRHVLPQHVERVLSLPRG